MDKTIKDDDENLPFVTRGCPWCKEEKRLSLSSFVTLTEPIGYRVQCRNCFALGPIGNTKASAINQWNNGFAIHQSKSGLESIIIPKERTQQKDVKVIEERMD